MKDYISIMVVDNDPEVIKSALTVLYNEGHSVEGVLSGIEAIHKIKKHNYDLVFTDLTLRGIDSLTLIKWINQYWPATGIVALSGKHLKKSVKEAYRIGIICHVIKPFTPGMLLHASAKALDWIKENALTHELEDKFEPDKFAQLDELINQYRHSPTHAIRVLTQAQEIFGYLPYVIQKRIALGLNMHPSEIHAIVSFYSGFRSQPEPPPAPAHLSGIAKAWDSVAWMTGEKALHSVDEFIKSRRLTS